jgi:hypothetical protein
LIRWQKRAAMWKHGFESRWGATVRRVIHRLPGDEPFEAQGAPELVAPLPARADRLELDLVGENLPQHLPLLDGLPAQETRHVADPSAELLSDLVGVEARDLSQALEPCEASRQGRLPCLLGTEPRLDLVGGERTVGEGVDETVQPLLNLCQLPLD